MQLFWRINFSCLTFNILAPTQSTHAEYFSFSCLSTFANSDRWSQLSSFFSGDDNLPLFCLISFPSAHTSSCRQESHVDNFFPTLRSLIRQSESLRMSSSVIQKPWTVLVAEIVMKYWYYNLKIRLALPVWGEGEVLTIAKMVWGTFLSTAKWACQDGLCTF